MSDILGGQSFNVLPHLVALAIAYLLALPIGWNREQEERSAGLRTFPLVAVACCGLIQAAEGIAADNPETLARIIDDPDNVAQPRPDVGRRILAAGGGAVTSAVGRRLVRG